MVGIGLILLTFTACRELCRQSPNCDSDNWHEGAKCWVRRGSGHAVFQSALSRFKNRQFAAFAGSSNAPLNPERGLMVQTKTRSSNYQPLAAEELVGYRTERNATIIHRIVVLDSFIATPTLSQGFLSSLEKDFETADSVGFSLVLRFHYNDNDNPTVLSSGTLYDVTDADIDIAESHIQQLGNRLDNWQHVILAVEAGFIGAWGEWYYSVNYSTQQEGGWFYPTEAQFEKRRRLVEALLTAFPSRQILLRYVEAVQKVLGNNDPLTEIEAFDGSKKSRLGIHNDCFLADERDSGTFQWNDPEVDQVWLEKQSNFTFVGGETCKYNPPRSDCFSALADIERYHWTFIGDRYHLHVLDSWKAQGCYEKIAEHLGYRLVINHQLSEFPETVAGNGRYVAKLNIQNIGVGRIINTKSVKIILTANEVQTEFLINHPSADLRKVGAGETIDMLFDADLTGMAAGVYSVHLVVEGEGTSVWRRIVLEPYQENQERLNILPGFVLG